MSNSHQKLVESALAAERACQKTAEQCTAARRARDAIWQELWEAFYPGMRLIAMKQGVSQHDVDDVVQEAFKEAWAKLVSLRQPESFPGWFATITVRKGKAHVRRARKRLVAEKQHEPPEKMNEASVSGLVESGIIGVALRVLEIEEFTVFFLHCCWELTFKDIHAHGIGTNHNAVRAQYQRARGKLQRELEALK